MSEMGVFFRTGDYAGFWRRLLVDVVDLVFAFVVYAGIAVLVAALLPGAPHLQVRVLLVSGVALWFGYFGLLKWSTAGTLGYRVARVRLTTLKGRRPSLEATMLRAAFLLFGPLNYLLDLVWCSGDAQRQALRDKFAATLVVTASAEPAGEAPIIHMIYNVFGAMLVVPEVRCLPARPSSQPASLTVDRQR